MAPQRVNTDPYAATAIQSGDPYAATAVGATQSSTRPAGLPPGMDLPGFPSAPPIRMVPPQGPLATIGSHVANLVTGPYHAFTDAPRNPEEQQVKGATRKDDGFIPNALGQFGLGAARMFVLPTVDALKDASMLYKGGGPQSSILHGGSYGVDGTYQPTAGSKIVDSIPIIGPWTRGAETEAAQNGNLSAAAGFATDMLAPKLAGKTIASLRSVAPSLAEGALRITASDRGYGKTIGRAALDDTTGVRPSTILKSTTEKLKQLTPQIDGMAANYRRPVTIQPAIDSVDNGQLTAAERNNVGGYNALEPVRDQLTQNPFGNNQPFASPTVGNPNALLSPMQTATSALELKRGLRDQFVKNWSPDAASTAAKDAAKQASGEIDSSLDQDLGPNFAKLNQRVSSLIPLQEAAEKLTRSAEIPQSLGAKLGKHTGALTGAAAGGAAFGPLGAAAGFALPEMISSPTAQMALARTLNSRLPATLIPPLFTGGILTPRKVQ